MSARPQKAYYTPEEYLELERGAESRSEYCDGRIEAMACGTFEHAKIASNINGFLFGKLLGTPCTAVSSDLKVRIPSSPNYRYPDGLVVCGEQMLEEGSRDILLNPTLVVELISPSTQKKDRTIKLLEYQRVDSMREIIHVDQDQPFILQFVKQDDGAWNSKITSGIDAIFVFSSIEVEMPLALIYDRITFPDSDTN